MFERKTSALPTLKTGVLPQKKGGCLIHRASCLLDQQTRPLEQAFVREGNLRECTQGTAKDARGSAETGGGDSARQEGNDGDAEVSVAVRSAKVAEPNEVEKLETTDLSDEAQGWIRVIREIRG